MQPLGRQPLARGGMCEARRATRRGTAQQLVESSSRCDVLRLLLPKNQDLASANEALTRKILPAGTSLNTTIVGNIGCGGGWDRLRLRPRKAIFGCNPALSSQHRSGTAARTYFLDVDPDANQHVRGTIRPAVHLELNGRTRLAQPRCLVAGVSGRRDAFWLHPVDGAERSERYRDHGRPGRLFHSRLHHLLPVDHLL
jgi:hypothetical protein